MQNPTHGIVLMCSAMLVMACMDAMSKHLAASYSVSQILAVRFWMFTFFAVLVRQTRRERLRLGATLWLAMVGGALLLAYVMYPFPG